MQRVEAFDRLGHVRVEGLSLGTYQLAIDCPSLGQRLEESLELGKTPATRAWQLGGGLVIAGRVTRPNGSAIRGVGIDVQPMGERAGRHAATCTPDASGVFECGGLQPGEYSVRAVLGETTASETVKVRIGDRSAEPIVLHTTGSATIRAFVRPTFAAASSDRVSGTRGRLVPVAHGDGGLRHYAQALDDHYVFDELPLGGYVVQLGVSPGPSPSFRSVQLERDGQVVDVELQREPAADLVGQVVDARNEPVPDAWVEIVGTEPDWLNSSAPVPPVLSDASGAFSIVDLRAGRYALRATHPSGSAHVDGASPAGPPVRLQLSDPKPRVR